MSLICQGSAVPHQYNCLWDSVTGWFVGERAAVGTISLSFSKDFDCLSHCTLKSKEEFYCLHVCTTRCRKHWLDFGFRGFWLMPVSRGLLQRSVPGYVLIVIMPPGGEEGLYSCQAWIGGSLLEFNKDKWKSCPWERGLQQTAWLGGALAGGLGGPGGQGPEQNPAVCSGSCEGHRHPGLYELPSQLRDRIFSTGLALTNLHRDTAHSLWPSISEWNQ